jgi:hypothetical protein
MPAIYVDWPDKSESAKIIGVSVKTVERLADQGKLQQKFRPRIGASPIAVFNPADVQKQASIYANAANRPFTMPRDEAGVTTVSVPGFGPVGPEAFLLALQAMLDRAKPPEAPPPAPVELAHLVTRDYAVKYLGYPRDWLRDQIRDGKLKTYGAKKISRFELETLAGRHA